MPANRGSRGGSEEPSLVLELLDRIERTVVDLGDAVREHDRLLPILDSRLEGIESTLGATNTRESIATEVTLAKQAQTRIEIRLAEMHAELRQMREANQKREEEALKLLQKGRERTVQQWWGILGALVVAAFGAFVAAWALYLIHPATAPEKSDGPAERRHNPSEKGAER